MKTFDLENWVPEGTIYPTDSTLKAQLAHLLQYAVLAPSVMNTQPWRFRVSESEVEFHLDPERQLLVADPDGREAVIAVGAALYLFQLAMRTHGLRATVNYHPHLASGSHLATITCNGECLPSEEDLDMIAQVPLRHTAVGPMEPLDLTKSELRRLASAVGSHGGTLEWVQDEALRSMVVELVEEGDKILFDQEEYRDEFAHWMRSNWSDALDGVTGAAAGHGAIASGMAPWVVRAVDVGSLMARQDGALANDAPALAVLTTNTDDRTSWLCAGQALCHVQLLATKFGMVCSLFDQPFQAAGLRDKLAKRLGRVIPQAILRVGFGKSGTSRHRPVRQALMTEGPVKNAAEVTR